MPNHEITQFIITELAKGEGKQEISNKLLFQGHKIEEINEAFASVNETPATPTPPQPITDIANAHVFAQTETNPQQAQPEQNSVNLPTTNPAPSNQDSNNKLLGIMDLLSRSWKIEQDRFKTLAAIYIIPFLILILGLILGISAIFITRAITVSIISIVVSFLLSLFLMFASSIALIIAIKNRDEKMNFKTAYIASFGKVIPFLALTIVMGIISIFGLILLIIPAFIFSIWFSFAMYAFASDDAGIIESLKLSKSLVNGKFFAVLYRGLGLSTILFVASSLINIIPLIGPLIGILVLNPLAVIYNFLLYEDLKRLEGKEITNQPGKGFKFFIILLVAIVIICFGLIFSYVIPNFIKNAQVSSRLHQTSIQNTTNAPQGASSLSNGANSATNSALDLQRYSDITAIQKALDTYYIDNKKYPNNLSQLSPNYLPTIPGDPKSGKLYTYQMENFTQPDYLLCGTFDNGVQKCFSVGVRSETYNQ